MFRFRTWAKNMMTIVEKVTIIIEFSIFLANGQYVFHSNPPYENFESNGRRRSMMPPVAFWVEYRFRNLWNKTVSE